MTRPSAPTRPKVPVVRTPYRKFEERVRAEVERRGMSFESFIRAGREDALEDPDLRDLWLRAGPILR